MQFCVRFAERAFRWIGQRFLAGFVQLRINYDPTKEYREIASVIRAICVSHGETARDTNSARKVPTFAVFGHLPTS